MSKMVLNYYIIYILLPNWTPEGKPSHGIFIIYKIYCFTSVYILNAFL